MADFKNGKEVKVSSIESFLIAKVEEAEARGRSEMKAIISKQLDLDMVSDAMLNDIKKVESTRGRNKAVDYAIKEIEKLFEMAHQQMDVPYVALFEVHKVLHEARSRQV